MSSYIRKSMLVGLMAIVTLALTTVFPVSVNAATNDLGTPRINKISQITGTSVVLPIHFSDLKKKNVVVSIRVLNKDNNKMMIQKTNVKLSKTGRAKITVTNLAPNTKYSFKVKIRRESSRSFSDSSDPRTVTTL